MLKLFLIWTAFTGVFGSVICFFESRRYTLYALALFGVFTPIIFGYMTQANLYIAGYAVSVLDLLFIVLIVIAYPLSRGGVAGRRRNVIDSMLLMLTILLFVNLGVGIFRLGRFTGVANVFRRCMFLPVYFIAVNILNNPIEVKRFYRAVMWFTLLVLFTHTLIALNIYIPPLGESAYERVELLRETRLLRSTLFFYEPFYIVSASISVCYLMYNKKGRLFSLFILTCAVIGAIGTQARTIYGGMFLVLLGVVGLAKGKIKGMIILLAVLASLYGGLKLVGSLGIDIFSRFTEQGGSNFIDQSYSKHSVRRLEWASLGEAIGKSPLALFTGHGFGVEHTFRGLQKPRTYFHNDYLGTFFYFGLAGLVSYCFIVWGGIFRGRQYCRDPEMALIIMPTRLIFFSAAGVALLTQQWWLDKGTALVMIVVAISSNIEFYADKFYGINDLLPYDTINHEEV